MNEEFYAVIKLISGEEIFSKVCSFDENDETMLLLDSPIVIEKVFAPKIGAAVAKVNPWIKLSEDEMFLISLDKVITITESKDQELIQIFKRYNREKNKRNNRSELTPNMGYVSSITEARLSLEKIYKSNSFNRPSE
jgi:hypothetical protein